MISIHVELSEENPYWLRQKHKYHRMHFVQFDFQRVPIFPDYCGAAKSLICNNLDRVTKKKPAKLAENNTKTGQKIEESVPTTEKRHPTHVSFGAVKPKKNIIQI